MAAVAIIGAGNLGTAIADGLLSSGAYRPEDILLCRRHPDKVRRLSEAGLPAVADAAEAARRADLLLVCVQPSQFRAVADALRLAWDPARHVLVSTMTGLTALDIETTLGLGPIPVVRAMPNTAIAVRQSMTCLCSRNAGPGALEACKALFSCLGEVIELEEGLMKAATVLAASNVAFVMRMIRALIQGGIQLGFHSDDAQEIAVQVVKGAAALLAQRHSHPEMEIDKVTTPRGCTIEGLNEMEHRGLSSAIIKGLVASYDKIAGIKKEAGGE